MQQVSPSEETSALLTRLSSRPGVQSTLVLSHEGAIVKSTGLLTDDEEEPTVQVNGTDGEQPKKKGTRNAQAVATLVMNFINASSGLVGEMNGENDELKLVRLRTKKNELVIVPDSKYYLVVVHDTPPA